MIHYKNRKEWLKENPRIVTRVDRQVYEILRSEAAKQERSIYWLVRKAVEKYISELCG